ncbi:hypothetical protein ABIB26_000952 [Arthrobacter sp. UYEF20]
MSVPWLNMVLYTTYERGEGCWILWRYPIRNLN